MRSLGQTTYTLCLMMAAYGVALFALGPILTSMAVAYRVPLGHLGGLFSIFFIGFTLAAIFGGLLSLKLSKRWIAFGGLVAMGTGLFGFGLYPYLTQQPRLLWGMAAVFLFGIGGAATETNASAIIAEINPDRKAFAINIAQVFFGIGAVGGPMVLAWMLSRSIAWQLYFVFSGVLCLVIAVFFWPQCRVSEAQETLPTRSEVLWLLKSPTFWGIFASMMLYVGAEIGFTGWLSPYLETELEVSKGTAGSAMALFWLAMTAGRMACSWLSLHWEARKLLLLMASGGTATVLILLVVPGALWGILGAMGVGLFFSGMFGMILAYAGDRFPDRIGPAISIILVGVGVGGMSFPALMGYLSDFTGLRMAMLVPAGLMAAIIFIYTPMRSVSPVA